MKPIIAAPLVAIVLAGAGVGAYLAATAPAGGTARPFISEVHAQEGELTVTPSSGPVGTTVVLEGVGCNNPGQPVSLAFGIGGPEPGGGTVGAVGLPEVSPNADGSFRTSFVIPSVLGPYQGRGGGATVPGTYTFFSFPLLCGTKFTVTVPGLPGTGSSPPASRANQAGVIWVLALGSTLATAGLGVTAFAASARLRRRP
jgi:hypothetical protein